MNILLTEDHATTRMGIKQIIRSEFGRVAFGEAGNGQETLILLTQRAWDAHILDISLPDRSGLDLLPEIKRLQPTLPVLIYSAHPENQFAVHALRAHAAGYLTKERAPEELGAALRTILSGSNYISPCLAARLTHARPAGPAGLPHEDLSKREFQVLRLLATGLRGKSIAVELGLSEKTVSTYRTRVLQKMHYHSAAELIRYAVRYGLV